VQESQQIMRSKRCRGQQHTYAHTGVILKKKTGLCIHQAIKSIWRDFKLSRVDFIPSHHSSKDVFRIIVICGHEEGQYTWKDQQENAIWNSCCPNLHVTEFGCEWVEHELSSEQNTKCN
jgi:hypothetical protein